MWSQVSFTVLVEEQLPSWQLGTAARGTAEQHTTDLLAPRSKAGNFQHWGQWKGLHPGQRTPSTFCADSPTDAPHSSSHFCGTVPLWAGLCCWGLGLLTGQLSVCWLFPAMETSVQLCHCSGLVREPCHGAVFAVTSSCSPASTVTGQCSSPHSSWGSH